NAMRIGMFLTPVFWSNPGQDSIRAFLSDWNPFAWFLHLGRAPILDGRFPLDILVQCVALGIVLWLLAIVLLGRTANRIPFIV
ncbi:MAG: ABC transporter permease, partial [Pseudomonadota bacterium]